MIVHSRFRRRRGVTMVESSVGLVFLLFVIFGIMEYGQLIMARQLMNNAARSAARVASSGRQPAYYADGITASPSPGGVVTTAYLTTWITKALALAPVSNVVIVACASTNPGPPSSTQPTPNPSLDWSTTQAGQGFFIQINATYIPLFSGNRIMGSPGNNGPMVGSVPMSSVVYMLAEANN